MKNKKERMDLPLYYFLFFILGFICSEYLCPLINSLSEILLTKLEIYKGKYTLEVHKLNQKINNLAEENQSVSAIGFVYPDEDAANDY